MRKQNFGSVVVMLGLVSGCLYACGDDDDGGDSGGSGATSGSGGTSGSAGTTGSGGKSSGGTGGKGTGGSGATGGSSGEGGGGGDAGLAGMAGGSGSPAVGGMAGESGSPAIGGMAGEGGMPGGMAGMSGEAGMSGLAGMGGEGGAGDGAAAALSAACAKVCADTDGISCTFASCQASCENAAGIGAGAPEPPSFGAMVLCEAEKLSTADYECNDQGGPPVPPVPKAASDDCQTEVCAYMCDPGAFVYVDAAVYEGYCACEL